VKKSSNNDEFNNLINSEQSDNTGFDIPENNNFNNNNINSIYNNEKDLEKPKTNLNEEKPVKKVLSKWDEEEEEEVVEEDNSPPQTNIIDLTIMQEDSLKESLKNSDLLGVHASLGNFSKLKTMLKNQFAINNIAPLKNVIKEIYMGSYSQLRLSPCAPAVELTVRNLNAFKNSDLSSLNTRVIYSPVNLSHINMILEEAYSHVDNKRMEEADELFISVFKYCIFIIPENKDQIDEVNKIINNCTEYLLMIRLSKLADEKKSDKYLYSQLCLLATLCQLNKPSHTFLILKRASISTKNVKNYLTCVSLIYKMLALEKSLKDENYDTNVFSKMMSEYNSLKDKGNDKDYPFNMKELEKKPARESINSETLELFSQNETIIFCPLCNAGFKNNMIQKTCTVCLLTVLGKETITNKIKI
jgi:hypothetical protein